MYISSGGPMIGNIPNKMGYVVVMPDFTAYEVGYNAWCEMLDKSSKIHDLKKYIGENK